jgi:hypothetical protein
MKTRYLAAALVGAWLLRRRNRKAAVVSGSRPRPVAGTPFRLHKDGVRKPEDVSHAPPPAGETGDIPAL